MTSDGELRRAAQTVSSGVQTPVPKETPAEKMALEWEGVSFAGMTFGTMFSGIPCSEAVTVDQLGEEDFFARR